ncbi:AlpA family phage regulatory protein [Shewanella xiamenensis]
MAYTATFPPKAVSLCSRTATWVESEVQEWIFERIEARDC